MKNDLSQPKRPISISFQKFRDEEIVEFFANENRTFHPDDAGDNFGRSRLVGAPHFSQKQKGTAAFRASPQASDTPEKKPGVLRENPADTIPLPTEILEVAPDILAATINEAPKRKRDIVSEPSFSKPARPLGSVLGGPARNQAAAVIDDPLAQNGEALKKKPLWNRPVLIRSVTNSPATQDTSSVREELSEPTKTSPEEKLLTRIQDADEQLGRLIETWPRLSPRLKETIAALVEVGEKNATEQANS